MANGFMAKLHELLKKKLHDEEMDELFYDMELPLTKVLSSMEVLGFKVDREVLNTLGTKFKEEIETTQKEIFDLDPVLNSSHLHLCPLSLIETYTS